MKKKSFTLLEILLVISLMVIVAQLSIPTFMSMKNSNDFDLAQTQILQGLRRAKTLALAGTNDNNWGIYFSADKFTVYCGIDYQSRDTVRDEETAVNSNITLPQNSDVNFEKNTGGLLQSKSLAVSNDTHATNITIDKNGIISY
jgi:type II secretory pathway pseudopilin PulG